MKRRKARLVAERITRHLFVNGAKEKADVLKMYDKDGRYLGGWCYKAVFDAILSRLPIDKEKTQ